MVPSVAEKLLKAGYTMQVEAGAGVASGFSDAAYKSVGCEVVPRATIYGSDITFTVTPPPAEELGKFKDKMVVGWVGRMLPDGKAYVEKAVEAGVSLVDTTAVPRITTAQKLDVLSSQSNSSHPPWCAGPKSWPPLSSQ